MYKEKMKSFSTDGLEQEVQFWLFQMEPRKKKFIHLIVVWEEILLEKHCKVNSIFYIFLHAHLSPSCFLLQLAICLSLCQGAGKRSVQRPSLPVLVDVVSLWAGLVIRRMTVRTVQTRLTVVRIDTEVQQTITLFWRLCLALYTFFLDL